MAKAKTVKVRIVVAIDERGGWNAAGWSRAPDGDMRDAAAEYIEGRHAYRWLTAEVALPLPVDEHEVAAEVSDGE